MKNLLKEIIYFLKNLFIQNKKDEAIVLMYHSVDDDNDIFFTVRPDYFEKQIKYLVDNNYNIVSINNFIEYIKNKSIPPKTILLTFDDGFTDNYRNVFPILQKYNISATIFISTDMIGQKVKKIDIQEMQILNWDEILEMKKSGLVFFGSHCAAHKKLVKLSKEEIENELKDSKIILEKKLGCEVNFMAYPFGSFNSEVKEITSKYYQFAFSVNKGKVELGTDLLEIKRNSIDSKVSFNQFKGIINHGRI